MIRPDFSEAQLQQLINTEIVFTLYRMHGKIFPSIVLFPWEEALLGWDTGYYFPWLKRPPHFNHKGCNFFIQFKISELIEGRKGREYKQWQCPYMRFHLYYLTKDPEQDRYVYDFSQFNILKNLSAENYPVYYSTNHILSHTELLGLANTITLLNVIPFLDITNIGSNHRSVTFTQNSPHFILYSEPEEIKITKWDQLLNTVKAGKSTDLTDDTKILSEFILRYEYDKKIDDTYGILAEMEKAKTLPAEILILAKAHVISKYLKRYFDLYWFKL